MKQTYTLGTNSRRRIVHVERFPVGIMLELPDSNKIT